MFYTSLERPSPFLPCGVLFMSEKYSIRKFFGGCFWTQASGLQQLYSSDERFPLYVRMSAALSFVPEA